MSQPAQSLGRMLRPADIVEAAGEGKPLLPLILALLEAERAIERSRVQEAAEAEIEQLRARQAQLEVVLRSIAEGHPRPASLAQTTLEGRG